MESVLPGAYKELEAAKWNAGDTFQGAKNRTQYNILKIYQLWSPAAQEATLLPSSLSHVIQSGISAREWGCPQWTSFSTLINTVKIIPHRHTKGWLFQ